jgi:hypothetical protein
MTAPSSIDPIQFLHEQLAWPLRRRTCGSMLTTFINTLMSAKVDAVCDAIGSVQRMKLHECRAPRRAQRRPPPPERIAVDRCLWGAQAATVQLLCRLFRTPG